jgi:hypothetical protein
MTDEAPKSLPPDLARLLASEAELDEIPASVEASLRAGLAAIPSERVRPDAPRRPARTISRARAIELAAAALAAGAVLGALAQRAVTSAPPAVPASATPGAISFLPPAASSSPPSQISAPLGPQPAASPAASVAPSTARSAPAGVGLAGERTLLERARAALARDDADAALAALDEHARSFPHGALAEERELLAVRALTAAARTPEARARAARFRHAYPNSVYLDAVDALSPP